MSKIDDNIGHIKPGYDDNAGHRERVRERIAAETMENFKDYEVLEFVLFYCYPRGDTKALAKKLLREFGSLSGVFEAEAADLTAVVSERAALLLANIAPIFMHSERSRADKRERITNRSEAEAFFVPRLAYKAEEQLYAAALDNAGVVKGSKILAEGNVNSVNADIKSLVTYATRLKASKIVLAHNHPSRTAKPSFDDAELTKKIAAILFVGGLELFDHLIVAGEEVYSFKADGELDKIKQNCKISIKNGALNDVQY